MGPTIRMERESRRRITTKLNFQRKTNPARQVESEMKASGSADSNGNGRR